MTRSLFFVTALGLVACGPRTGPLNADFTHTHEVEYKPIKGSAPPPDAPAQPNTSVKRLDMEALPEGLRKRASNQALKPDPLRRGKFIRIRLTDIETATGYPTLADPHRVLGEFVVKLRVRYDAFSADDEEVLAEEQALSALGDELASDAAKKNGGNAIVRVHNSMKPDGKWWRYPYPGTVLSQRTEALRETVDALFGPPRIGRGAGHPHRRRATRSQQDQWLQAGLQTQRPPAKAGGARKEAPLRPTVVRADQGRPGSERWPAAAVTAPPANDSRDVCRDAA